MFSPAGEPTANLMSSTLPITNNNVGIDFTAVNIYDCVSSYPDIATDKVVHKEDAGWIFAFRTRQYILPHFLMKRILDFAVLPHAVVPLGWNVSRADKLLKQYRLTGDIKTNLTHAHIWVFSSINCSNIIKKDKGRIADDSTHWVLENPMLPHLSLWDHAHTPAPLGAFQTAFKYQICKKQLTYPAAELFKLQDRNCSLKEMLSLNQKRNNVIGGIQRDVEAVSTMVRELFLYRARHNNEPHRFKSTNPLDKEFLSYPVHDFNTIKQLRQVNTRLKRLIEDHYCTMEEQQCYYEFVHALESDKDNRLDSLMQDIVYNEGLMKIEAALFQPDYTTWSANQLKKGYQPCPFSIMGGPIKDIQNLPFCLTALLSLVFMSVMIHAITVSSFALDLLSQYSIWNDSNATNTATATATTATFTTLEEVNALEDQMTIAALLVGALPVCICVFLLCRCHWPVLICCCHGNIGLHTCITQRSSSCGARTLYCCGKCFYLDCRCGCKHQTRDPRTGKWTTRKIFNHGHKRLYKKIYHRGCCANGFVFLFFTGPILAMCGGVLLWIKSVIQINKDALTSNSTWTPAHLDTNRGIVTYNSIDGNYGYLCCLVPLFIFLFVTMGVFYDMKKENRPNHCFQYTKRDLCLLIHPISFVASLFFAAICFIYQYVQSMAEDGISGGGTNGTFEGTYDTHGAHGTFAFHQTHQSSTTSTPDFQWTIIVLPFFTVVLLICLGIPCTFKIMNPGHFCIHRRVMLEDCCKVFGSWVVYTVFFLLPAIGFLSAAVGWDCVNNKNTLHYEDTMPGTLSSFFFVVSDSTSLRTLFVTSIALICVPLCLGSLFLALERSLY